MQHRIYFLAATILPALALILEQSTHGAASAIIAPASYEEVDYGSTPQLEACHLEKLVVDFEDLNLHFISKPRTVNIGQCVGYCPDISGSYTNTYYRIMELLHSRHSHNTKQPCCVPIEYSSLQVLLWRFDPKLRQYQAHIDTLENAQVTKCGCR